jgi:predicted nuclease of predicted toxin-antitoxin system
MRFLADMGISMVTVNWLRELGHDAKHLTDEKLFRLSDDLILEKAKSEGRILLTCDLDFGYLLSVTK